MISTEVLGSSEEVGSSARMMSGSCMMARAMPTRWRWPPDSASARWLAKPGKPDRVEQLEGARDVAFGKFAQPGAPDRHVAEPAAQQVLHHGQALDQIVFLEHHADAAPRAAAARGRTASRDPARETGSRPRSAATSRLMQRISVLLPVPDGPMMAVRPEPGKVRSMPRSTGWPCAIFLGKIAHDERAVFACVRSAARSLRRRHHGFLDCSAFFFAASASRAASFS